MKPSYFVAFTYRRCCKPELDHMPSLESAKRVLRTWTRPRRPHPLTRGFPMSKQTHFLPPDTRTTLCGLYAMLTISTTGKRSEVTCKSCRKTTAYKNPTT